MSALRVHRFLERSRRTIAAVAVVCALSGAVAVEHPGMAGMHMPDLAVWCLAILPGAAFLTGALLPTRGPARPAFVLTLRPQRTVAMKPAQASARASPTHVVLRL